MPTCGCASPCFVWFVSVSARRTALDTCLPHPTPLYPILSHSSTYVLLHRHCVLLHASHPDLQAIIRCPMTRHEMFYTKPELRHLSGSHDVSKPARQRRRACFPLSPGSPTPRRSRSRARWADSAGNDFAIGRRADWCAKRDVGRCADPPIGLFERVQAASLPWKCLLISFPSSAVWKC